MEVSYVSGLFHEAAYEMDMNQELSSAFYVVRDCTSGYQSPNLGAFDGNVFLDVNVDITF